MSTVLDRCGMLFIATFLGAPLLMGQNLSDLKGKERENGDEPCKDPK